MAPSKVKKELTLEGAKAELLQATSLDKDVHRMAKPWVAELTRLTGSLQKPNFRAIEEHFGPDQMYALYDAVPAASLAVSATFVKVVKRNRLDMHLATSPSELTAEKARVKASWESLFTSVFECVSTWVEGQGESKSDSYPVVGSAMYASGVQFLTGDHSDRVAIGLKRVVLELLSLSLLGCSTNKALLSNPTNGLLRPGPLGRLLYSSSTLPQDVQITLWDVVAHLNPRAKDVEGRKGYADVIFGSFNMRSDVFDEVKDLLVTSPNQEWFQTRGKLMQVLAEWDINRLQLFPISTASREGVDLLDNDDDREGVSDGLKYLFFDSEGIKLEYWTQDEDARLCIAYADIINTTFIETVVGVSPSTILSTKSRDGTMYSFSLSASRSAIQNVCAHRPLATPVETPTRASVMLGDPFVCPTPSDEEGGPGSDDEDEEVRCLTFNHEISTPLGFDDIANIKVGDSVYGLDETGRQVECEVTKVHKVAARKDKLYQMEKGYVRAGPFTEEHKHLVDLRTAPDTFLKVTTKKLVGKLELNGLPGKSQTQYRNQKSYEYTFHWNQGAHVVARVHLTGRNEKTRFTFDGEYAFLRPLIPQTIWDESQGVVFEQANDAFMAFYGQMLADGGINTSRFFKSALTTAGSFVLRYDQKKYDKKTPTTIEPTWQYFQDLWDALKPIPGWPSATTSEYKSTSGSTMTRWTFQSKGLFQFFKLAVAGPIGYNPHDYDQVRKYNQKKAWKSYPREVPELPTDAERASAKKYYKPKAYNRPDDIGYEFKLARPDLKVNPGTAELEERIESSDSEEDEEDEKDEKMPDRVEETSIWARNFRTPLDDQEAAELVGYYQNRPREGIVPELVAEDEIYDPLVEFEDFEGDEDEFLAQLQDLVDDRRIPQQAYDDFVDYLDDLRNIDDGVDYPPDLWSHFWWWYARRWLGPWVNKLNARQSLLVAIGAGVGDGNHAAALAAWAKRDTPKEIHSFNIATSSMPMVHDLSSLAQQAECRYNVWVSNPAGSQYKIADGPTRTRAHNVYVCSFSPLRGETKGKGPADSTRQNLPRPTRAFPTASANDKISVYCLTVKGGNFFARRKNVWEDGPTPTSMEMQPWVTGNSGNEDDDEDDDEDPMDAAITEAAPASPAPVLLPPSPPPAQPEPKAKSTKAAPLPSAPKKPSPKKKRPPKPVSNLQPKLDAAARLSEADADADATLRAELFGDDSDSELSALTTRENGGSSRPTSVVKAAPAARRVGTPKRKQADAQLDEDDRPAKRSPARARRDRSPPGREDAVDSDASDDLAQQTLAPPPVKQRSSKKKKVYASARKNKDATPVELSDDGWDDLPAPTKATARREPLPRKAAKPAPKTPKKAAPKKPAKAAASTVKKAASTAKKDKRAISDDEDILEEEEEPRPAKKKSKEPPARSTPARKTRRAVSPTSELGDAATSEAGGSEVSSQSGRPRRRAAVRARRSFSSRPPGGRDDLEPLKEEEPKEEPTEPYIEDVWSRGKYKGSKVVGLPKKEAREREPVPQPHVSPSPPPVDFYPPEDDNMADYAPPRAGPSSSQSFAYEESQAAVSKAPSQASDEMDVIGGDTSAPDALDVIGPDSSVLPMPSPLAERDEEDEVDNVLDDRRELSVGQLVEDSMPLGKKRISSSAEQRKKNKIAAANAAETNEETDDNDDTIVAPTPRASRVDASGSQRARATNVGETTGPTKPVPKKAPGRVKDSDDEEIDEFSPPDRREMSEEIEDADDEVAAPSKPLGNGKPAPPPRSALKPASQVSAVAPGSALSSQRIVRIDSKPEYLEEAASSQKAKLTSQIKRRPPAQASTKPPSQARKSSRPTSAPPPEAVERPAPEQPASSSPPISTLSIVDPPRVKTNSLVGAMKPRSAAPAEEQAPPPTVKEAVSRPPSAQPQPIQEGPSTPQSSLPPHGQGTSAAASSPPPAPVKAPPAVLVPTPPRVTRQASTKAQQERQRPRSPSPPPSPQARRRTEQAVEPRATDPAAMSTPQSEVSVQQEVAAAPAAPRKHSREDTGRAVAREPRPTEYKKILLGAVDELDRRRTKQEKGIRAKSTAIRSRLISDTKAIATHFGNRTEAIVESSRRHRTLLKELDGNIALTTRKARQSSEEVVKAVSGLAFVEKRAMEQWPEGFFA